MTYVNSMLLKVLSGENINSEEALILYTQPLKELSIAADNIRHHFCSNKFDFCTIINAKSGCCSEDCKFCAQSVHNHTNAKIYPLLDAEEILQQAQETTKNGIHHLALVTSGKKLSDTEIEKICTIIKILKDSTQINICASFGLLNKEQYAKLKSAGVSRIHNNLEASANYFPTICTTHSFTDKVRAIKAAQDVGLYVCSGGIMGLGESIEDRIDMALTLRELNIKSVPINILNPIPGTPFGELPKLSSEEVLRTVAVYRFLLPDAFIRLAGGRSLLDDKGLQCFQSGANAAITGDMLTTTGTTIASDFKLIHSLNYEAEE